MSRQLMNQALISQVLFDLRNGQVRRCVEMGFTEDDLNILNDPETISVLSNTNIRWSNVTIDREVLTRLLNRVEDNENEINIINQMLLLGASSKMITDIFSINQREVAFRKRALKIDKKQGRWQELSEEKDHELYYQWKQKVDKYRLDTDNLIDMAKVCMILAKDQLDQGNEVPMAMIWQAMEKWLAVINHEHENE